METTGGATIFDRVLVAVDPSEESVEAARQAARVASPGARVVLVAVAELEVAVQAGFAAATVAEELRADAQEALEAAEQAIAPEREVATRLVEGPVSPSLLDEVERAQATLLCLGSHGHGRAAGIMLGSTVTTVLRDAPCSVLVARRPPDPLRFPASIVVGSDGSQQAGAAVAAAAELAGRFGAGLRTILASRGKQGGAEVVEGRDARTEVVDAKPVEALVQASSAADLVVVGSSGRHGMRALGSVSERVAHQAATSVLVVRAL